MLRIVMRVLEMVFGHKSSAPAELGAPSKQPFGLVAKVIALLCLLLGVVFIADTRLGSGKILGLFKKPKPEVKTEVPPIPDLPPDDTGLETTTGPVVWERYHTLDRVCSAEFPGSPKRVEKKTQGVELQQMLLQRPPGKGFYALNLVAAPPDTSQTLDEAVETLRNAFGGVTDHAVKQAGFDGWQLDFIMSDKVSMNRIFVWQGTAYRGNVVIDKGSEDDPDVKRFFDSIQFNLKAKPAGQTTTPADATTPSSTPVE